MTSDLPNAAGFRRGKVRLDGQQVGVIEETERGLRFTYEPQWAARSDAIPVSLTLPVRAEPYEWPALHPFFENLLPEGWLLALAIAKLKVAESDFFGLLLATCADCAGAVEIVQDPGGL